ncbi:MAG: alpha/beta-type small acid-soluble spore protein [Oscillibacter sp.]|nr:alpha/beta-type small acid-soluble spore protein [Oscillibacter sp.]
MSTKNSNKLNVPEAKAAMDQFKMEAASEVGVNLKNGYNGHLTSREAGSVGGQMVKKMSTVRTANFTRKDRTAMGHEIEVRYIAGIMV